MRKWHKGAFDFVPSLLHLPGGEDPGDLVPELPQGDFPCRGVSAPRGVLKELLLFGALESQVCRPLKSRKVHLQTVTRRVQEAVSVFANALAFAQEPFAPAAADDLVVALSRHGSLLHRLRIGALVRCLRPRTQLHLRLHQGLRSCHCSSPGTLRRVV